MKKWVIFGLSLFLMIFLIFVYGCGGSKVGVTGPTLGLGWIFGGSKSDSAYSVQQTSDGGYIVAGKTYSNGAGLADFRVIKLDSSGNKIWDKAFGGVAFDYAYSVQQTSDGGYIVAGKTNSYGAGSDDFWVIKLDSSGTPQYK